MNKNFKIFSFVFVGACALAIGLNYYNNPTDFNAWWQYQTNIEALYSEFERADLVKEYADNIYFEIETISD